MSTITLYPADPSQTMPTFGHTIKFFAYPSSETIDTKSAGAVSDTRIGGSIPYIKLKDSTSGRCLAVHLDKVDGTVATRGSTRIGTPSYYLTANSPYQTNPVQISEEIDYVDSSGASHPPSGTCSIYYPFTFRKMLLNGESYAWNINDSSNLAGGEKPYYFCYPIDISSLSITTTHPPVGVIPSDNRTAILYNLPAAPTAIDAGIYSIPFLLPQSLSGTLHFTRSYYYNQDTSDLRYIIGGTDGVFLCKNDGTLKQIKPLSIMSQSITMPNFDGMTFDIRAVIGASSVSDGTYTVTFSNRATSDNTVKTYSVTRNRYKDVLTDETFTLDAAACRAAIGYMIETITVSGISYLPADNGTGLPYCIQITCTSHNIAPRCRPYPFAQLDAGTTAGATNSICSASPSESGTVLDFIPALWQAAN